MFTPEKMIQIHVVFSDQDIDPVAETLVRQGAVQLIDSAEADDWAQNLNIAGSGDESESIKSRKDQIEVLFKRLGLPSQLYDAKPLEESWDVSESKLKQISSDLETLFSARESQEKELGRLKELNTRLQELPHIGFELGHSDSYSYLAVETGKVADENVEILQKKLAPLLHVMTPLGQFGGMTTIVAITLRRDKEKLQAALREAGFEHMNLANDENAELSPELTKDIETKIEKIKIDLLEINAKLKTVGQKNYEFLRSILYTVRREGLKQQILKYFRKTERTYLLTGWLPRLQKEVLISEIKKATQGRCIIEVIDAEKLQSVRSGKLDVPVQLNNPSFIKPFELITDAYGIPAYRTIDPTPLLGISFILMFGMMFGDVGHGLILTIIGFFLALKGKKEMMKHAGMIMVYAGVASIGFGFLFGSIFGEEHLLPTLWVKPMESITHLFKVAIYFGIGMIFTSMLINIINGIRRRDFMNLLFDKAGLLAAILYWCGILVATRMVTTEVEAKAELPVILPAAMIISTVLLFLREPIVHLMEGKKQLFPEGLTTGIMGGFVEILEIFLGFLANTVSFIRVAAFGLAHAGLFMAIFSLSDMVSSMASKTMIMIFGNILIICLEGLVVTIQVVRLEYYEFFSRFFVSGATAYHPLKTELENP